MYREIKFNIKEAKKSKLLIISLGGKIKDYNLFKNFISQYDEYYAIAADSGLSHLNNLNLNCHKLIADFDSIDLSDLKNLAVDCEIEKLNVDKDFTDGEACFRYAENILADAYLIIASLESDRFDHVIANINLFMNFSKKMVKKNSENCLLLSNGSCLIYPLFNKINYSFELDEDIFLLESDAYFSILPRIDLHNLNISGLKYNCEDVFVDRDSSMTVSNKYLHRSFNISFEEGEALLIMNTCD